MYDVAGSSNCTSDPRSGDGPEDGQGGTDAVTRGLGEEVGDGLLGAFVAREEALEPDEDVVEDDCVNQSLENK